MSGSKSVLAEVEIRIRRDDSGIDVVIRSEMDRIGVRVDDQEVGQSREWE